MGLWSGVEEMEADPGQKKNRVSRVRDSTNQQIGKVWGSEAEAEHWLEWA